MTTVQMLELSHDLCSNRKLILAVALLFFVVLSLRDECKVLYSLSASLNAVKVATGDAPTPTERDSCSQYNGILHIQHGDEYAAGTAMGNAYTTVLFRGLKVLLCFGMSVLPIKDVISTMKYLSHFRELHPRQDGHAVPSVAVSW